MLGDVTKTELTQKVWINCLQYSLNSSSLDQCVLSALYGRQNGTYDGTDNECEIFKLQKSPSEILEMLKTVYGASTMCKSDVSK
jgi:hypothetical protein